MTATQPDGMQLLSRGPSGPVEMSDVAVLLHPSDHVAIAKQPLLPRTILKTPHGDITVAQMIPPGHKFALLPVIKDEPIRRYGQIIGFATQDVAARAARPLPQPRGWRGRPDARLRLRQRIQAGRVRAREPSGARSWASAARTAGSAPATTSAVLASVNCSSSATRQVAEHFRNHRRCMAKYPNVDGVIPLATKGGCGAHYGSSDLGQLQRTMAGIVDHPNVGGLRRPLAWAARSTSRTDMIDATGLGNGHQPKVLTIQQDGGFRKTVEAGHRGGRAAPARSPTSTSASRSRPPNSWWRCSAAAPTAGRA